MSRSDVGLLLLSAIGAFLIIYTQVSWIKAIVERRKAQEALVSYYIIKDNPQVEKKIRIGPYDTQKEAMNSKYFLVEGNEGYVAKLTHYSNGHSELLRVWPPIE